MWEKLCISLGFNLNNTAVLARQPRRAVTLSLAYFSMRARSIFQGAAVNLIHSRNFISGIKLVPRRYCGQGHTSLSLSLEKHIRLMNLAES